MLETLRHPRTGFLLALLAAVVCAACAVTRHVEPGLVAWRAGVAFATVWLNQSILSLLWTAGFPEPAPSSRR